MTAASYDPVVLWTIILAAALGTFAMRLSFIELLGGVDRLPPGAVRALELVPAAVLAAIVLPRLLVVDGAVAPGPSNLRLVAGAVAALVAWRSGSLLATVAVGMAALWGLVLLVG